MRRLAYLRPAEDATTDAVAGDADDANAKRKKFRYRPNLLIVDGGQPQVAAAARALADSGITGIQLCGIAKRLEEIWLPDSDYPVILPRNSDALFLIQRIRDEAHRFAIAHQRSRRKRDINTVLAEIPGLGPARVKVLLRHFGSVARLREAGPEAIEQVSGIGPTLAATIHEHLRS
jgi:excinuclease ABC subunit C